MSERSERAIKRVSRERGSSPEGEGTSVSERSERAIKHVSRERGFSPEGEETS